MNSTTIPLDQLPVGKTGEVCALHAAGQQRRRMLDLGLVQGTAVEALHSSPAGDPTAYLIRGTVIALRSRDAGAIEVSIQ
ncbi:MAG: FeoA family protein [Eubacteriales bacterium]|nr:FeoA family protein [Eubacteriales bacterium]